MVEVFQEITGNSIMWICKSYEPFHLVAQGRTKTGTKESFRNTLRGHLMLTKNDAAWLDTIEFIE